MNRYGEQKGVDSLLVTDLINLARNRAVATALLVTGDEDIRVGVQQAQDHGIRVHLVGIEPAHQNQSNLLVQEADTTIEWGVDEISTFLHPLPTIPIAAVEVEVPESSGLDETIAAVVAAVVRKLDPETRASLRRLFDAGELRVPPDHDRLLLKVLAEHVQHIEFHHKVKLREAFRRAV